MVLWLQNSMVECKIFYESSSHIEVDSFAKLDSIMHCDVTISSSRKLYSWAIN